MTLVITELDPGGAERMLVTLATGIDRRRFCPSVIALGPSGELVAPLRAAAIPTTCLDVPRRRPASAVRRLAAALRRTRPALVQSFLFHANVASRLAALQAGRPWVIGGIRVAQRARPWHGHMERVTERLGCGWVCVSEGVRQFSLATTRLDPARLTVIPNGVDLGRFEGVVPADRNSLGVPADAFLTLFVGRLDPQKGWPELLEAAGELVRAQPDWHLIMAGDGPDRSDIETRVASSDLLRGRVHLLGRRRDVESLLLSANLVVSPSRWEGMPNALLEAMAAKRAVVATAVEGSAELVTPGQTGWLVPPRDAAALTRALQEAASNPSRLLPMGATGHARVRDHYTTDAMIRSYDRLWTAVLGYDT